MNEIKKTTSTFKILKSSWGIWLQITGESIPIKKYENQFEINLTDLEFSEKELEYIKNGFEWVAPIIAKTTIEKRAITIKEIKLVFTDYQEEGLFYGIAFWLSEHFEFEMPKFDYRFNKSENKYEFPDLK